MEGNSTPATKNIVLYAPSATNNAPNPYTNNVPVATVVPITRTAFPLCSVSSVSDKSLISEGHKTDSAAPLISHRYFTIAKDEAKPTAKFIAPDKSNPPKTTNRKGYFLQSKPFTTCPTPYATKKKVLTSPDCACVIL